MPFQNVIEKKDQTTNTIVILSQYEMGTIVGGDVTITIQPLSDVLYWVIGGAVVGFIVVGTGGIVPGMFYGGLFGWIFG